jgi:hypothetical protein
MLKTHLYPFLVFLILGNTTTMATAETISYSCSFFIVASPKGLKTEAKAFELKYVIDRSSNKAYIMGNAGSAEVTEIANSAGVSFLEITGSGNVMVTAITTSGDAVHSRHSMDAKKIIPTQYYGKCKKQ